MKRKLFFPLIAALALVGCTSEEELFNSEAPVTGESETNYLSETSYLSVNIVSGEGNTLKRAGEAFEDGIPAENKIESIRFYFFNEQGVSANVIGDGNGNHVSYMDLSANDFTVSDESNDVNIEKIVNAVLIIETPKDKIPSQIVAIINPMQAASENVSVSMLQGSDVKVYRDYAHTNLTVAGKFPMTNSVFAKGGKVQYAVPIAGHLRPSKEAALANPLNINVERCVAKVVTKNNLNNGITVGENKIYPTGSKDGEEETVEEGSTTTGGANDVYVKFLGWDITTTQSAASLVKKINPQWGQGETDNLFGNNFLWNDAFNSRSYWAYEHNTAPRALMYGTFNEHKVANTNFNTGENIVNWLYCNENAAVGESGISPELGKRTQVIIAAELCDANGSPVSIVEVKGIRMREELFKDAVSYDSYIQRVKLDGKALTFDDFKFVTNTELTNAKAIEQRYVVYMQLADGIDATKLTLDGNSISLEAVNNALVQNMGKISYWKEGRTYYYTDIRHLANENRETGNYGVVRNHIYKISIEGIKGLGTPVYNPDEEIIPEKPVSNESYLAAQINVLSWRIVENIVNFDWGK